MILNIPETRKYYLFSRTIALKMFQLRDNGNTSKGNSVLEILQERPHYFLQYIFYA